MPEVRVDPLSGRRVILPAPPSEPSREALHVEPAAPIDPASDRFAPGNEQLTPAELYAVRPGGGAPDSPGWTVRVLPGDPAALDPDSAAPDAEGQSGLYTAISATGAHEVIVNTARCVSCLAELEQAELAGALEAWRERMLTHADAACRHLTVDERRGGATAHTHAELYAFDFVPAAIARERERFGAYASRTMGQNLQADLVQEEVRRRVRVVAIDDDAVLIAPYASVAPYQLMLAPRRERARFEDPGPTGAALLHDGLRRLARLFGTSPPLSLWVRTAPQGADHFCWRIDILPRLTAPAGLELGTGVQRNAVAPEWAAGELREA